MTKYNSLQKHQESKLVVVVSDLHSHECGLAFTGMSLDIITFRGYTIDGEYPDYIYPDDFDDVDHANILELISDYRIGNYYRICTGGEIDNRHYCHESKLTELIQKLVGDNYFVERIGNKLTLFHDSYEADNKTNKEVKMNEYTKVVEHEGKKFIITRKSLTPLDIEHQADIKEVSDD